MAHFPLSDIGAMTEVQLREEVHYWREVAAVYLRQAQHDEAALGAVPAGQRRTSVRFHQDRRYRARDRVREHRSTLESALTGMLGCACEGCGQAVLPGQLVISYEDVGECHANCMGFPGEPLVEGDRIPVDPDSLILEDGEERPAEAFMTVFASSPLYTAEQIEAMVLNLGTAA